MKHVNMAGCVPGLRMSTFWSGEASDRTEVGKYIKGTRVVLLTMFMELRLLQINSKQLLEHISVQFQAYAM